MPVEADYNFGKHAVKAGRLRQDQLEECVEILVALERVGSAQRLWDIVRRKGYMSSAAIAEIRGSMTGPEASVLTVAPPQREETPESALATPPSGAPGFVLVHVRAGGQGKSYPLPPRPVTLGKAGDCDIVLPEPGVEAHHARVRVSEEFFMVEDVARGRDVLVNGRRVASRVLVPYDLIGLGDALVLFMPEAGEQPAPGPLEPEGAAAASGQLQITQGERKGAAFLFGPRSLVVGRSRLANARLAELDVSEFHAHLACSVQGCRLTDLNAVGGTRVNGMRVSRHLLSDGDNVAMGSVTFAFHLLGTGAAPRTEDVELSLEPTQPAPGKTTVVAAHPPERDPAWDIQEEVEVEPMTDPMMRRGMPPPRSGPRPAPLVAPPSAPGADAKPGQIQLTFTEGPWKGRKLLLAKSSTVFGRGGGVDVDLPGDLVSRRHAEIVLGSSQIEVRDLDSRNGTFLNGRPVTKAVLHHGDSIRMGASALTVEAVPSVPQTRENP